MKPHGVALTDGQTRWSNGSMADTNTLDECGIPSVGGLMVCTRRTQVNVHCGDGRRHNGVHYDRRQGRWFDWDLEGRQHTGTPGDVLR